MSGGGNIKQNGWASNLKMQTFYDIFYHISIKCACQLEQWKPDGASDCSTASWVFLYIYIIAKFLTGADVIQ